MEKDDLPEQSKVIPDFPYYRADVYGNIWSVYSGKWKKLAAPPNSRGYLQVELVHNKEKYQFSVHTLILWTFVGDAEDWQECRHLDGNPANNRLDNLCWGSKKQNAKDKQAHGTIARGESHGMHVLTIEDVINIRNLYATGEYTQNKLATMFEVCPRTVNRIVHRLNWKHV